MEHANHTNLTNRSIFWKYGVYDQCPNLDESTAFLEIRYYLIGVLGLIICSFGIIFNVVLLKILLQPALRTTYLSYLSALAVLDINIAITYVVVMSLSTWYEYFSSYPLYFVWHTCLPYFFTLSRVATLTSTYLVVACTLERYLEVVQLYAPGKYIRITHTKRYVVVALVILASVAFRIVVYWEIDIVVNDQCRGSFSYFNLNRTWLVENFYYSKIYSFYVLHIVQVFFPFLALLLLNLLIVKKWRIVLRQDSTSEKRSMIGADGGDIGEDKVPISTEQLEKEEMKKRVKYAQSARKMMIAIVTSYLICNLLNLVLTFLEHLDEELLHAHREFYSFASDTVTLLTVVNATVRLPIYYGSNVKIRSEIRKMFRQYSRKRRTESMRQRAKSTAVRVRAKRQRVPGDSGHCYALGTDSRCTGRTCEMVPLFKEEIKIENGRGPVCDTVFVS